MPDLTAKRTLVKSPPELWEELSEVDRLAKHLGAFGEISITKLEPEHTVAWEGERASGTVSIEPSGWGTKVTLRAELPEAEAPEPEPEPPAEPPEPEPEPEPEPSTEGQHLPGPSVPFRVEPPAEEAELDTPEPAPRRGFMGWLFRRRTDTPEPEPEPVAVQPQPEPEPVEVEPEPEPLAAEPLSEPLAPDVDPDADALDDASALDPERVLVILDEALDALGAAHHRPFSRG